MMVMPRAFRINLESLTNYLPGSGEKISLRLRSYAA
jgi:hypothetical protein